MTFEHAITDQPAVPEYPVGALSEFQGHPVKFLERIQVATGVICDSYVFVGDPSHDLGDIAIKAGCKTPRQLVLEGERTIEGYIAGKGKLTIQRQSGSVEVYEADGLTEFQEREVVLGDRMQWKSDQETSLHVYEICYPSYSPGRYQDEEGDL